MEADKAIDTSPGNNSDVDKENKNATTEKPQFNAKSVNDLEVKKFQEMSQDWWKMTSEPYLLFTLNQIRVPLVVEKAKETGIIREEFAETDTPLKGLRILDVGCGGGFYCEALAKLGANVVGIDVTEEMIEIAKSHQDLDETLTNLEYKHITVEEFALDNVEAFDIVVCSAVVEHVNNPRSFVAECAKCLKFGGPIIMQTVSKTFLAKIVMIYLAEYIFRMIPVGSHDYEMFVTPEDLSDMLAAAGCKTSEIRGMGFNPFTHNWFRVSSLQVNYSLHAVKTIN